MKTNVIYNEECLTGMAKLPDKSIDMILCDLPYEVTDCKWDKMLPLDSLWEQYERIIKDHGAIVLTSIQPFTTKLIQRNMKIFRYSWYWIKNGATGFCFARYQPMRNVEDVIVFYKKHPQYNPQGLIKLDKPMLLKRKASSKETVYNDTFLSGKEYERKYTNYPKQTLYFNSDRGLHPTQKPVKLFEFLIQTYTNPGDVVLDNCMGSGTTAVAAINTGRQYIGYEKSPEHYDTALKRIDSIKA